MIFEIKLRTKKQLSYNGKIYKKKYEKEVYLFREKHNNIEHEINHYTNERHYRFYSMFVNMNSHKTIYGVVFVCKSIIIKRNVFLIDSFIDKNDIICMNYQMTQFGKYNYIYYLSDTNNYHVNYIKKIIYITSNKFAKHFEKFQEYLIILSLKNDIYYNFYLSL